MPAQDTLSWPNVCLPSTSDLILARKEYIIILSTTQTFWAMSCTSFPIWLMVAILNFKIYLVPLDNYFPVALLSTIPKGIFAS